MESRETSLFVMLVLMYLVYDLEAIILGALLIYVTMKAAFAKNY